MLQARQSRQRVAWWFEFVLLLLWCVCFETLAESQDEHRLVLSVTVTDKDGKLVRGLHANDFEVRIDNIPQKIGEFREGTSSASVGISIDASGSTYTKKKAAQIMNGVDRFLELSDPANEYLVVGFNSQAFILQDWTADHSFVKRLDELVFKGQTALYDSLQVSIDKVSRGHYSKRVLILISDGQDSLSKYSFNQTRDLLRRSDVTLYCIYQNAGDASSLGREGQDILSELAGITGGKAFAVAPGDKLLALVEVFEFLATELQSQYHFVIDTELRDDKRNKWHRIKVQVVQSDSNGKRQSRVVRTREAFP
jgi:Ca-activated chloride channel family protein